MSIPKISDWKEFAKLEITKLAKDIQSWIGNDGEYEDYIEVAESAYSDALGGDNGYDLARGLENDFGFTPDNELVELLDGIGCNIRDAHRKSVAKWWVESKLEVPELGRTVSCKRGTGIITKIYENDAKAVVTSKEAGHVESGGTLGWVIPFEEIIKL